MDRHWTKSVSRRRFLKTTGAAALAVGAGPAVIIPGRAQPKTLSMLVTRGFIAGFDQWLRDYAKSWGQQNDIRVIVDIIKYSDRDPRIAAEATAQQGHDMFESISTSNTYQDQIIDHRELYEECERRFGKVADIAKGNTYNLKTGKYNAFYRGYGAAPVIFRKDLWDSVAVKPDTWEDIRLGGRKIKLLHGHPVGLCLSPTASETGFNVRSILYSFGASIQNERHEPVLKSPQALEALKYLKALYEEAMTEEVVNWDNVSNNRFLLSGEASLTLNSVTILRSSENKALPVRPDQLGLAKAPQGPAGRISPDIVQEMISIWKFSKNIESAQQFLIDYIANFRQVVLASEFFLLPVFPQSVPDLAQLLANDAKADPRGKYSILADADTWTTNFGYPGYLNVASEEVLTNRIIEKMATSIVTSEMTPEEALIQADQEVRKIYDKWQALGKI